VRDSLPGQTMSELTCTNCHLDFGTRAWSAPWVGVYGRFPQYRSRNDRVNVLEDRINDCFERSLNGKALSLASQEMRDIVAYMAWLSRKVPIAASMEGQGFARLDGPATDTVRGAAVFTSECARCHGSDGAGTDLAPPLWGEKSFTIGAGMGRVRTAAAFIKFNMPYDRPGSLSEQQAFDVAAYITSRPRPDFVRKENDWPNGDHPPDVPYVTRAARAKAAPGRVSP
jgi:thiosulfate dehydrogenase